MQCVVSFFPFYASLVSPSQFLIVVFKVNSEPFSFQKWPAPLISENENRESGLSTSCSAHFRSFRQDVKKSLSPNIAREGWAQSLSPIVGESKSLIVWNNCGIPFSAMYGHFFVNIVTSDEMGGRRGDINK